MCIKFCVNRSKILHLNKKIHRNTDLYVTDYEKFHSKISRYFKNLFLGYQEHTFFLYKKFLPEKILKIQKFQFFW